MAMASKLTLQKNLAAKILKVGKSKVWIDPAKLKDAQSAITRIDVKKLIKQGVIKKVRGKVRMPAKALRKRHGPGSRKGAKYSRLRRKRKWINTVRPLRRMLQQLKADDSIDNRTFRKLYMLVKGGQFRSRSHLGIYLKQHGILKEKK
jgi:large subunit ribosomal protein L19e